MSHDPVDEFATAWASRRLAEVLDACWGLLARSAARASEPMHTGTLASLENGAPSARTVVLRAVDPRTRELTCHTDARSPKAAQLQADARIAWLFYDPPRKVQIALRGRGVVHGSGAIADARWNASTLSSRRCYLVEQAPGTALAGVGSGLPARFADRVPGAAESEAGRANFAALATVVDRLDWLHLAAGGHSRARFDWSPDGVMNATWIAP